MGLLFFNTTLVKREVYSCVIVFLELKAKRRQRHNQICNSHRFLLPSSCAPQGYKEQEKHTLFYLLLAQLIVQFSEFCPTELIWILQSQATLFLFALAGNSNRLFPKSGKAVIICIKYNCPCLVLSDAELTEVEVCF